MNRFQLAFRNIQRNHRRTLLNLTMIAGGFCAIVLFQGFTEYLVISMRSGVVDNQFGHFQVAKSNFWDPVSSETAKNRSIDNPAEAIKQTAALNEIEYASGRITFYGLLSTGNSTISALFVGFDPVVEKRMKNGLHIVEGKNFSPSNPDKKVMLAGKGIIKKIGGKIGQELTILGSTYDGVINALDVKLEGVFQTTISEIDDTTIYIPLETAQKLLDTNSVERIVYILKDESTLNNTMNDVAAQLPKGNEMRSWLDLASLFRQVQEYFSVQNRVIEIIILSLVLLSISNTVGMSIFERTGEIGTLRAIGDTSQDIIKNFTVEGLLLGVLGSILGCFLAFILSHVVNLMHMMIPVPGASVPLAIQIQFLPYGYLYAGVLAIGTSVVATYFPSLRISKMGIVEALRHNI